MRGKVVIVGVLLIVGALIATSIGAKEDNRITSFPLNADIDKIPVKVVKLGKSMATANDGNVLVSADSEYDDVMPCITIDGNGNIVVTWTQRQGILAGEIAYAYSSDNGQTWTSFVTELGGLLTHSDISWQDCPTYRGLYGVYIDQLNLYMGMYTIGDVTDPTTWEISYWTSEIEDPIYACVADNTYLEGQYYDIDGPACMYIYHEIYDVYDIPACPCQMIADLSEGSGELTFDGQSHLVTAPANNPDMAGVNMDVHYVWDYYNATLEKYQIVWKKIIPVEGDTDSTDIEFTPYQEYIDTGRDPAISKSGDNVVIVYMNNDNVYGDWDIKCAYSNDDGATWSISTVVEEHIVDEMHPDVYVVGNNVYVAYISNGNLYLVKSKDGGATWGEPEQVNDVDGTVVAAEGAVDICSKGIVWVDNRNGNNDIYFATLPAPIITLSITGGFGVKANICNEGTEAAENLAWSVDLSGLIFVGKHAEGTIDVLNPGECQNVGPGLVFGFGPTTITVNAGGTTATAKGFVLGPLVLGVS